MPPIPALPPTHSFGASGNPSFTAAPQFYYPSQAIKSESDYNNNLPIVSSQYQNTSPTKSSEIPFNRIPSPFKLEANNPTYGYNNNNNNSLGHEYNHEYNTDSVSMSTRQPRQPRVKSQPNIPNTFDPNPQYTQTMSNYALAPQPSISNNLPPKNPNPDGIEIRTKFPVARIKRIMQADEEVGKVAQVTPVAVSKALELFMISLVQGAARVAREKGGKRVTAGCLKRVVEGDEQFDFLSEIVGKVQENVGREKEKDGEEGTGTGKKRKAAVVKKKEGSGSEVEGDNMDEDVEMGGEVKKKGRGKGKGGRKKKVEESV